jgi:HAD superfamily hydrolase (TIGR01509 family)
LKGKFPQLVIFDCDGVLVDSEPLTNRILAEMITEAGWPIEVAECCATFNGRTIKSVMQMVEAKLDIQLPADWEAAYNKQIHLVLAEQIEAIPGIEEVLNELAVRQIKVCVASSAPVEKMQITLGKTGLWDRFAPDIFSATMVENGKPAPDLFLFAARQMEIVAEHCLVVEDSPTGAQAARAAGMACIGYAGGQFPHSAGLQAAGAQVIRQMSEFWKYPK